MLLLVGGLAVLIYRGFQPYRSASVASADGRWQAWLQRPNGSMEPKYYSVMVAPQSIFGRRHACAIAGVTNTFAERYSRLSWPASDHLLMEYGLSNRDTTAVGRPYADTGNETACPPVRFTARPDHALDPQATAENDQNIDYAVPPPSHPDFPEEPVGSAGNLTR